MAKKNRLSATAQINDLVQEAVKQGNYSTLGDEVGDVIKTSIETKVLYHEPGTAGGKVKKYAGELLSILFGVPCIGSLIAWLQAKHMILKPDTKLLERSAKRAASL